ncbi:hypothetical protein ES703_118168 [subsurface metagenome]
MTRYKRHSPTEFPSDSMDVTVADSCRGDTDFHLTFLWRVNIYLFHHQWFTKFVTDSSFHYNYLLLGSNP